MAYSGILFIVCGPSGVGKTTLSRHLREARPDVGLSVSYTTRSVRGKEVDGESYHFVDVAEFEAMRDRGEFAEWAGVHGNYYGTSVKIVEDALTCGRDLLFDIDYQGARQLRERFPRHAVTTLVVPPSMQVLRERLTGRGTESAEELATRIEAARHELEQWETFDFLVENADLDDARRRLVSIYDASASMRRIWAQKMTHLLA